MTQRFLRRIAIVDLAHDEGRRQHPGRQVAARRVHPEGPARSPPIAAAARGLDRAAIRSRDRAMRGLIDLWVGVQTWLFETFVSPVLFALNLMEWFEPAFNAVEFFMLGVVQIAVIALVMRLLERRWGVERGDERLVGVDRVYTVLNKLGIMPLLVFVRRLSDHQPDRAPGAGAGLHAAAARAADPGPARQRLRRRSWSISRSTTSPPTGCIAPSIASPGGGRCTACITASAA